MSREELVEAYLGGRISRRIFIRGLAAAGVSLTAAIAYSNQLGLAARATPLGRRGQVGDLYPPDLYPPDLYPPDSGDAEPGPKDRDTAPEGREAPPAGRKAAPAGREGAPAARPAEPVKTRKITFTG